MVWTFLCLWLITWLLCWTFITIGSKPENTSRPKMIVLSVWLSLGVVLALLCITVLVAKIFLLIMIPEFAQILLDFLLEVIRNNNSAHTVTSTGIQL